MARAGLGRAAVVAAGARLADARGLEGVTLAALADELGVRAPSLYAHVGGLDDLRRGIGALGARELAAAMTEASIGRSGAQALGALARAYREYARAHPGRYAAAQRARELRGDPEGAAAGAQATQVTLGVLRGYGLEGDEAIHASRTIRVALHGFVTLEAAGGFAIDVDLEQTFKRILVALDRALREWPAAAGSDASAEHRASPQEQITPTTR
jgi:AcrR family transcriptional regulator